MQITINAGRVLVSAGGTTADITSILEYINRETKGAPAIPTVTGETKQKRKYSKRKHWAIRTKTCKDCGGKYKYTKRHLKACPATRHATASELLKF
jgi:hypothetical protein